MRSSHAATVTSFEQCPKARSNRRPRAQRASSAERDTIRYAVRGEGIKLQKIVLKRPSLRRLATDPDAANAKWSKEKRTSYDEGWLP